MCNLRQAYPRLVNLLTCILCITLLLSCGSMSTGNPGKTFSSWEAQFALAKTEATRIDPSATLVAVITNPIDCATDAAKAVNEDFFFIRTTGPDIRITLRDSDPPLIVDINPGFDPHVDRTPSLPQSAFTSIKNNISSIRVSPREACQSTIEDAQKTLGATGVLASVAMFLDRDALSQYGVESVWEVTYRVPVDAGIAVLGFDVSAKTGEILKRYPLVRDRAPTATPTNK